MRKDTDTTRLKAILHDLLDQYLSGIPDTKETYLIQKHYILYNFIVKYEPNQSDIIKFVELLVENNENISQIQKRIWNNNNVN